MGKGKSQHVVPRNNQWGVVGAGNERATRVVSTQKEAIQIATDIAKNNQSEVVIHRQNGRIREGRSYGNDPYPPKG